MRVLIACEESQAVCKAFRDRGHEAYSCDVQPCSGGHPEWHIEGCVIGQLNKGWDLMIGHPPCTYLSNAGAVRLYPKGELNPMRYAQGNIAAHFFYQLWHAPIDKICLENPIPSKIFKLPEYDQKIQPYHFGHPYRKATCLWLKNLPPLMSTQIMEPVANWVSRRGQKAANGSQNSAKMRSKTFPGIAAAMAEQWG